MLVPPALPSPATFGATRVYPALFVVDGVTIPLPLERALAVPLVDVPLIVQVRAHTARAHGPRGWRVRVRGGCVVPTQVLFRGAACGGAVWWCGVRRRSGRRWNSSLTATKARPRRSRRVLVCVSSAVRALCAANWSRADLRAFFNASLFPWGAGAGRMMGAARGVTCVSFDPSPRAASSHPRFPLLADALYKNVSAADEALYTYGSDVGASCANGVCVRARRPSES